MKIAVLDDYANVSQSLADWSTIKDAEVTVFDSTLTNLDELKSRLEPFDVICLMRERTPFGAPLIDCLPNLKLLVTSGPRNLSIDLTAATQHNITVCGTESRKTTTSELATLLMLALSRGLIPETQSLQTNGWQSGLGRDLHGLDLGLIGLGKIGAQMATIGRAFGMNIHAWSSNLDQTHCDNLGVQYHSNLNSLMGASDVVSVHLVLSERTTHLVDSAAFAAMRDRAIFINTSRGPIADESALLAGLNAGKPWMAGIDVFSEEPLPMNHPLRDASLIHSGRLLLSPHLGYATEQTFRVFYTQTVEAINAWVDGNPIRQLN
ncbi:MAG: D-2-hydroxyacid dehydrogenase family protein [Gammaproteobacteria bacterium]|nr:D-2-hydroxyacid dehydrogenase family protein [Gammaproteobacteria bacterium]